MIILNQLARLYFLFGTKAKRSARTRDRGATLKVKGVGVGVGGGGAGVTSDSKWGS